MLPATDRRRYFLGFGTMFEFAKKRHERTSKYIFMRTFFTKTEHKTWQRIGCGLTIVSADFYALTIRSGSYVRAAGGKNYPLQSGPDYGLICAYLDVDDSSGTNESQTASSKFRLKKVRGKNICIYSHRWRGV